MSNIENEVEVLRHKISELEYKNLTLQDEINSLDEDNDIDLEDGVVLKKQLIKQKKQLKSLRISLTTLIKKSKRKPVVNHSFSVDEEALSKFLDICNIENLRVGSEVSKMINKFIQDNELKGEDNE